MFLEGKRGAMSQSITGRICIQLKRRLSRCVSQGGSLSVKILLGTIFYITKSLLSRGKCSIFFVYISVKW